ncbi:MAG TPA: S41 family peptidase [Solirubrobacteraceae bacterium]|nr:S41 family peptidase [Solirubrobacteraceae bacterium]
MLAPIVLLAGVWLGGHPQLLPGPVADALVDREGRVVAEAIAKVDATYIEEVDEGQLADAAIAGIVRDLDDEYSSYLTASEYDRFQEATHGRFQGVGITVRGIKAGLQVQGVVRGSPAARAGIRRGDVIVAAGGRSLAGRPTDVATALVKGPAGSEVRLRLRRDGRTLTKRVRRATVSVPVVEREARRAAGQRVAHITLSAFTQGAHEQLGDAIGEARERGAEGIVLDLRGNGGGLVKEAQRVASEFVEDGEIVTTRGRSGPDRRLVAVGSPAAGDLPVVVLVDGATASAAEIVTGALQDHDRATVVGRTTFGKGVFQTLLPLDNGGALNLTTGRYFTPDGRNLAGDGIAPDVRAADDADTPRDEALRAALETLGRKLPRAG